MDAPRLVPLEAFAALRPQRAVPPLFQALWAQGSLEGLRRPAVAIVGTRAATAYGSGVARRFAAQLGAAGCCIVSGLALGIDAAAHQGALESGAPTIGVLGSGHERFFPVRNRALAARMIDGGGAVLSPYPPLQAAQPHQFLQRNGVVAALADAVLVIEAPARSGALNTAGWAAGRIPVFAVPGDVDRAHVAGCHALIRDGATLARSAQDVLDDLGLAAALAPNAQPRACVASPLEQRVMQALQEGEVALEDLLHALREPAADVLAALSMLELSGALEERPGRRYVRR